MCKYHRLLPLALAALLLLVLAGPVAAQRSGERAIPPSAPTPVAPTPSTLTTVQDEELVIDRVDLEKYPRVTARFTMRPLNGRPAPYLEVFDIMIYTNGVWQPVLESH